MHVKRNIKARSQNHFYSGKAINITQSEGVCLQAVIQHAIRMLHIVICGLSISTVFSTLSHKGYDFRKKKVVGLKMCFDFLYNCCLIHLQFKEELSEVLP
jgi:hypothetical protein